MTDQTPAQSDTTRILKRLGPAGVWAVFCAIMPLLGSIVLFANIGTVSDFLRQDQTRGLAVYITVFMVTAGLALLPTYAQAVVGGWAFGLWTGAAAAMIGFVLASLVGYEVGRLASQDRVRAIIDEHPKWKAVRDALIGRGFLRTLGIVALVRFPPNSPFALTNLVMAGTKVPRLPYVLGTAIGMFPRTAVMAYLGSTLSALTDEAIKESRPWWYIAGSVVLTIIVLIILAEIGKRAMARVVINGRANAAAQTPAS